MSVLVSGSQEIDTQREDHEMAEGENGHRHTKGRLRRSQPRQRRDLGLLACRTVRNLICCLSNAVYFTSPWQPLVAQTVKNQPAMRETWVQSLGWEEPPDQATATHGEGNGNPLQYSCLENSWQATVHGITKSQT